MKILTINNRNFQKPSRNPSNRTKVKIQEKKCFGQLIKKIWFRVCSVTAEMFEHRNSGENRRKRSEMFFENLRRAYKDLIQVKKNFKIISCLCTFNLGICMKCKYITLYFLYFERSVFVREISFLCCVMSVSVHLPGTGDYRQMVVR